MKTMRRARRLARWTAGALGLGAAAAWPTEDPKEKPAADVGKLPENWGEYVSLKDLTDELAESATRTGQNLKKPADFDKFLKNINTEGHLTAVLAALIQEHPDAGNWKGVASTIQPEALAIAKAAEAKAISVIPMPSICSLPFVRMEARSSSNAGGSFRSRLLRNNDRKPIGMLMKNIQRQL